MTNERDIAWAAGVFDGEGCVYVQRNKRRGGRVVNQLQLIMGNTSPELVERYVRILRELGVSPQVVFEPKHTKKPIYYVKVARKKHALILAKRLLDDTTAKRAELQMAIWYLERACQVRQHVATQQDLQVFDAIRDVKHGGVIPDGVRRLIDAN